MKCEFDVRMTTSALYDYNMHHAYTSASGLLGTMVGIFIFFMLTYQILAVVTLPFIAFYIIGLFRIFKCWKSFKYSAVQFWLMSIGAMAALFLISRILLQLITKFIL